MSGGAATAGRLDDRRPLVLILMGAFWPGSDSSGPNISVKGLCMGLADEFRFRIIARDRPFAAKEGPSAATGHWHDLGFAEFQYCSVGPLGARGLRKILRETPFDILWLNGFFDREFTIPALFLRRLKQIAAPTAILSPRGEFAGGALSLKSARKQLWLRLARAGGFLADVWLHSTGPRETPDIAAGCPFARGLLEAPNVRAMIEAPAFVPAHGQRLRVAFLGRITRVKNLDFALKALSAVRTPVVFDIYGPISDPDYWAQCQALIAGLPPNVEAIHHGEIDNHEAPAKMAAADLLLLPTMGENFGHAIFEALASGAPVLISDQTLWRNLAAQKAGWDLPLADPAAFTQAIETMAAMPHEERMGWRAGARALVERWHRDSDASAKSRLMLRSLLAGNPAQAGAA